jgi:N-acetylmuramic acid 6-phosphate etherase
MSDTESIQEQAMALDLQPSEQLVAALIASQRQALDAALSSAQALGAAVDAAAARLAGDTGRLMLVGAGASGRICVQDGAELWPTFGWPHERLELVMAGGNRALLESIEGVEDDAQAAFDQVTALGVGPDDVVVGVAASGRSPWTVAWVERAASAGALTVAISGNPDAPLLARADYGIVLHSGAEVLAGSTRLAAGTAQKATLNAFSTALMVRLNRSFENLMVDMAARNTKLDVRRVRMLQAIVPTLAESEAQTALVSANGWVKLAVLLAHGDSVESGKGRLERCAGSLRRALAEMSN